VRKGIPITVISTNFTPFVEGVLNRLPKPAEGSHRIHAVDRGNVLSTQKGHVIQTLAVENPNAAICYVGDGASDIPAIDASSVVAGYFALHGSSFERALKERNIPHLPFRTGHDIRAGLAASLRN
jgi:2-hydroxy-3-keto-5-methylthiopentenyl-1-phosphate phosphatase